MSEERNYSVPIIRKALRRHLEDAKAAPDEGWMAEVIALLIKEVAVVPPPVELSDTIPGYIYPH